MQLPSPVAANPSLPSTFSTRAPSWLATVPLDISINTNIVLQSIPTLGFNIGAFEEWIGQFTLDIGATLSVTGVKFAVLASGLLNITSMVIGTSARVYQRSTVSGGVLDNAPGLLGAVTDAQAILDVWIKNGAVPGIVQLQFAQSASSGTPLIVRAGSFSQFARVS